ncbi:hypothetical protein XarbCFBP7610_07020 [Xanthomonas arboricola]|nr:hypothetical protein XarbCFBP7610_07020 [Xanthomonas arboricola]
MQAPAHAIDGVARGLPERGLTATSAALVNRPLTATPAPRPGPRLRRGRFKTRVPVARKQCLVAPGRRGALVRCVWCR